VSIGRGYVRGVIIYALYGKHWDRTSFLQNLLGHTDHEVTSLFFRSLHKFKFGLSLVQVGARKFARSLPETCRTRCIEMASTLL
jgi:hypothetical protein